MRALLLVFGLLTVVDVVQTYLFPRYGLREGNRLLAKLMAQEGFDVLFLVKYALFAALVIATGQGWIGVPALAIAVALQAGVVGWNFRAMRK